jgi:hypothetical protein
VTEIKNTYEQFCTFYEKNVIFQETCNFDGKKKVVCTNKECPYKDKKCKNKLRQKY